MGHIMKAAILIATLIAVSSGQGTSTTTSATTTQPVTTTNPTPEPTEAPVEPPVASTVQIDDDNDDEACILIKISSVFHVSYLDENGETVNTTIPLPQDLKTEVNITGTCENPQNVSYMWPMLLEGKEDDFANGFRLTFKQNDERTHISNINLNLTMDSANFPDYPDQTNVKLQFANNETIFEILDYHSYKCSREETIELTWDSEEENTHDVNVTWVVSSMQYQAYLNIPKSDADFITAEDCEITDTTPLVVPIVVGCILLGLIVVVIVAYVIGRRKYGNKSKSAVAQVNSRRSSKSDVEAETKH